MAAFGTTDFRGDLPKITVLILHGDADADADADVRFEKSGQRAHAALPGSDVHLIPGGPHGCNVSHPDEWNQALITFLGK